MAGSGIANSWSNSHSPRSMKVSISSCALRRTFGSISSMRFFEKRGSRILRYFVCAGGSICCGIIGRSVPSAMCISISEEKISGWRSAQSTSS